MPSFIRTKKDEKRWLKAKTAASKSKGKSEEAFSDTDWALVNHIYQKMSKTELYKAIEDDDDTDYGYDPESELEDQGFSIIDPDQEQDEADQWLNQNDPKNQYEEYGDDEDEDADIASAQEDLGDLDEAEGMAGAASAKSPSAAKESGAQEATSPKKEKVRSRYRQPSIEELNELRSYTMPYERRLRDMRRLEAVPEKNPELALHGGLIEAVSSAYGDRDKAYKALINSKEYQSADPITQMEMDDKFHNEWHQKDPEHGMKAIQQYRQAHQKGSEGSQKFKQARAAQIQHVLSGGLASGEDVYSTEEGLQHAGGTKGEEGTQGTIVSDPAASFAAGNQEFIRQMAEKYKQQPVEEVEETKGREMSDIRRILGDAPSQNPKFNEFFEHHMPLIESSKKAVINRLGLQLDPNSVEYDMLGEAGLHGLTQAINDYNPNNPSGASFASHARNKIRGLMMQSLKNIDQIPPELRAAHKEFRTRQLQQQPPSASQQPKRTASDILSSVKHPSAQKIQERLGRLSSMRPPKQTEPAAPRIQTTSQTTAPSPQPQPTPLSPQPQVAAAAPKPKTIIRRPGGASGNQ